MLSRPVIMLTGSDLSVEDMVAIGIGDKCVDIDKAALDRCSASRKFLEEEVAAKKIIYGVNTSYGPMCNKIINDNEIVQLQINLIRSHAAGLGDPIKPYITRAITAVRLNTLAKGYSGVRLELLEHMKQMINKGICPYIPECGSVGASGDLIHLAHLALAIIGEGNVYYKGELRAAEGVYKEIGMKPFVMSFKEGIAIMNGTAAMTGIAAFALFGAKKLLRIACVSAAFSVENFGGIDDAFDEDLHKIKPHPGQIKIAEIIRNLYHGSTNITHRSEMHDRIRKQEKGGQVFETDINVQDVYSIRCAPQYLAPAYEAIEAATKTVEIEANSTNDNPIIIPEKRKILHGGNFHGESIGFAMDSLAMAIADICTLSDRRLNKLLDRHLNEGLPEHLIPGVSGLTMGFMGAQYLATSTTAENRQLANPVSTLSISCNASNQDVVSMGTVAARKAFKSVSNAKHVLTLEIMGQLQGIMLRKCEQRMGHGTKTLFDILTKEFSIYDNTRIFHNDLTKLRKVLFSSQIFDDLSVYF